MLDTIDREIFIVKIIRVLNFHVKNTSLLTFLQCSMYTHILFSRVEFLSLPCTDENILKAKISRSTVAYRDYSCGL